MRLLRVKAMFQKKSPPGRLGPLLHERVDLSGNLSGVDIDATCAILLDHKLQCIMFCKIK